MTYQLTFRRSVTEPELTTTVEAGDVGEAIAIIDPDPSWAFEYEDNHGDFVWARVCGMHLHECHVRIVSAPLYEVA